MAAPGALKSAGVGLAGELRSLIRVENPRTPLKLNGRRDVQGRTNRRSASPGGVGGGRVIGGGQFFRKCSMARVKGPRTSSGYAGVEIRNSDGNRSCRRCCM